MAAQRGKRSGLLSMFDLAKAIRAGKTTYVDAAYEAGLRPNTVAGRLRRAGWSAETGFAIDEAKPIVGRALVDERALGDWREQALCAQVDPELFHPEQGHDSRAAKAICAKCPVASLCLEEALANFEYGIWGGMTEKERRHMRKGPGKAGRAA